MRRAGARLVRIDDELVAMLAGEDFVGGANDRVGVLGLQPPGLAMRLRGAPLDDDDRVDEGGERPQSGDREVLGGAQRLDAVERVGGDLLLAERVLFSAEIHTGKPGRAGVRASRPAVAPRAASPLRRAHGAALLPCRSANFIVRACTMPFGR